MRGKTAIGRSTHRAANRSGMHSTHPGRRADRAHTAPPREGQPADAQPALLFAPMPCSFMTSDSMTLVRSSRRVYPAHAAPVAPERPASAGWFLRSPSCASAQPHHSPRAVQRTGGGSGLSACLAIRGSRGLPAPERCASGRSSRSRTSVRAAISWSEHRPPPILKATRERRSIAAGPRSSDYEATGEGRQVSKGAWQCIVIQRQREHRPPQGRRDGAWWACEGRSCGVYTAHDVVMGLLTRSGLIVRVPLT
jgi:hypothetical protein